MEYINATIYILLMGYCWKRRRCINLAVYYSFIWAFSACFGIIYVSSDYYRDGLYSTSLIPFLVLFVFFTISLLPFLYQRKEVNFVDGRIKWLNLLMTFIGSISILPFMELLYNIIELVISGKIMLLGAMYEDIANGETKRIVELSRLSGILYTYAKYFRLLSLVLFFYYINQRGRNIYILVGLFMNSTLLLLSSLTIGNRTELVWYSIYFMSLYILFRKTFTKKIGLYVKRMTCYLGLFFLLIISALSIGRYIIGYGAKSSDVGGFLYQYTCESMYNFNDNLYHENGRLNGFWTFYPIQQTLGLTDVKDDRTSQRAYVSKFLSSPNYIFYTYIGEFWGDFGALGAFLIVVLLSCFYWKFRPKETMYLENIVLLSIYMYMLGNGLFYYCYKVSYAPVFVAIIFYITAKLSRK